MHDDDLRARLASLIEPDAPTPAPELIRARGRRQRTFTVGAGVAALTTVAVLATGAVIGWPRVNPVVPVAVPSETATPSSPTPTASPSPTPMANATVATQSCSAIRAAWRKAMTTTMQPPASLGRQPRLEWVSGETWVASGVVNGKRVVRAFPKGLQGSSYRVGVKDPTEVWYGMSRSDGKVMWMWHAANASLANIRWRMTIVDTPGGRPREVVVPQATGGASQFYPMPEDDTLFYLEVRKATSADRDVVKLMQLPLNESAPKASVLREFETQRPAWVWGRYGDAVIFDLADGSRFAFDRKKRAEVTLPPALSSLESMRAASGRYALYEDRLGERVGLKVLDLETGDSRWLLDGYAGSISLDGNLALVSLNDQWILFDLDSKNRLDLGTDLRDGGARYSIYRGVLSRDGKAGDFGLHLEAADLPHSIPRC